MQVKGLADNVQRHVCNDRMSVRNRLLEDCYAVRRTGNSTSDIDYDAAEEERVPSYLLTLPRELI